MFLIKVRALDIRVERQWELGLVPPELNFSTFKCLMKWQVDKMVQHQIKQNVVSLENYNAKTFVF
jgi:hypothetical protein